VKERIYIAGPYTNGDVALNVRNALETADRLANLGFAPFVPHLTHFWHMTFPRPYEFWLDLDSEFLRCCHGVLRIPGHSPGADREILIAKQLGLPVFDTISGVEAHFNNLEALAK
jgi:hypothetical protein